MTTPTDFLPGQQTATASSTKPLWTAIGALGFAVLAMGGTMLYKQGEPLPFSQPTRSPSSPPLAIAAGLMPSSAAPAVPQYPVAKSAVTVPTAANAADDLTEKPAPVAPKPAPAPAPARQISKPSHSPTRQVANSSTSPSYSPPQLAAAAPVCAACGSVESVTPVERSSKPAGVGIGTVAGGVLGAVLGNQVGHGNGRTAAAVLGAVGGGFAGNAIEGKMRSVTVYQVGVRMDDGSRRTVELSQPPAMGSQVTVEGNNLRMR